MQMSIPVINTLFLWICVTFGISNHCGFSGLEVESFRKAYIHFLYLCLYRG